MRRLGGRLGGGPKVSSTSSAAATGCCCCGLLPGQMQEGWEGWRESTSSSGRCCWYSGTGSHTRRLVAYVIKPGEEIR